MRAKEGKRGGKMIPGIDLGAAITAINNGKKLENREPVKVNVLKMTLALFNIGLSLSALIYTLVKSPNINVYYLIGSILWVSFAFALISMAEVE